VGFHVVLKGLEAREASTADVTGTRLHVNGCDVLFQVGILSEASLADYTSESFDTFVDVSSVLL
jgi:hypothetical protein